jgi:hypothetical protein
MGESLGWMYGQILDVGQEMELHEANLAVKLTGIQKFTVLALPFQSPLVEEQYQVATPQSLEAMGDEQYRALTGNTCIGVVQQGFLLIAQVHGGFFDHEYSRLTHDGPRQRYLEPLERTERMTLIANNGFIALRQVLDKLMGVGYFGRFHNLGQFERWVSAADVVGHGIGEHQLSLQD